MENLFATFEPIELKSSPSKEDISKYYLENNIVMDNDYLNNYFGLNKAPEKPALVETPIIKNSKYNIQDLLGNMIYSTPKTSSTSSVTSSPVATSPNLSVDNKAKAVIDYFVSKGLTKEQAAGIAGNIHAESGFNTGAHGDAGTSFGLAQWHKDRKNNLLNFAKSRGTHEEDFNTQLDFLWNELQTTENQAFKELLTTKTATDAARVFAHKFERMAKYNPSREQMANYYYHKV